MSDLDRTFEFRRGDLLYGFEKPISDAKKTSSTVQLAMACGYFVRANEFNNSTILKIPMAFDPTNNQAMPQTE